MRRLLSDRLSRQGKHGSHSSPWQVWEPVPSHPTGQVTLCLCTHNGISTESQGTLELTQEAVLCTKGVYLETVGMWGLLDLCISRQRL